MPVQDGSNVRITLLREGTAAPDWQAEMILFMVSSGRWTIHLGATEYPLQPGGLLLVQPFRPHQVLQRATGILIAVHVPYDFLPFIDWDSMWCWTPSGDTVQYEELRALVAQMYQTAQRAQDNRADEIRCAFQIIDWILLHCRQEPPERVRKDPVTHTLSYLYQHWNKKITVAALAAREYISSNYLSHLFQKRLGQSLTDCLQQIRLHHAIAQLMSTTESVAAIAQANGFGSEARMIAAFKSLCRMTPGKYRSHPPVCQPDFQTLPAKEEALLLQRLTSPLSKYEVHIQTRILTVDAAADGFPLQPVWKTAIDAGSIYTLLDAQVQQQLAETQARIGFLHVKIYGITDSNLQIYADWLHDAALVQFTYLDMALNFVRKLGCQPWLCFGEDHVAAPEAFISRLVGHLIHRYGEQTVRRWPFALPSQKDQAERIKSAVCAVLPNANLVQIQPVRLQSLEADMAQLKTGSGRVISVLGADQTGWDTCADACKIAGVVCRTAGRLALFPQLRDGAGSLNSGSGEETGLLTAGGLPKAVWQVLGLLHRLSGTLLVQGDTYIAAREGHTIRMLFCQTDAEAIQARVSVICTGLGRGRYRIRTFRLGPSCGCALTLFQEIGAPERLSRDEQQYLRRMAQPQYHVQEQTISGQHQWTGLCRPDEILLVELSPADAEVF